LAKKKKEKGNTMCTSTNKWRRMTSHRLGN